MNAGHSRLTSGEDVATRVTALVMTPPNFTRWTTRNELGVSKTVQLQLEALALAGCEPTLVTADPDSTPMVRTHPAPWLHDCSGSKETHDKRVAKLRAHLQPLLATTSLAIVNDSLFCGATIALTHALLDVAAGLPSLRVVFWTYEIERLGELIHGYGVQWKPPLTPPFDRLHHMPSNCSIVFVSDSRRREILERTGVQPAPERSTVLPAGIDLMATVGASPELAAVLSGTGVCTADPLLFLPARILQDIDSRTVERVLARIRAKHPTAVLVSTLSRRSGVTADLPVVERWRRHPGMVLIAEEMAARCDVPVLTDRDVGALYLLADATVFPSRREGFGLPLVEGALARTPILCLDLPVVREVTGGRVFAVDPDDVSPGVDRLLDYLASDPVASAHRAVRVGYDALGLLADYFGTLVATRP